MAFLPSTKDELRTNKLSKQDFFNLPRNPIYIVLDSLKCAHNIGTILRLADAVLASKVYICGNTLVPPSRKIKMAPKELNAGYPGNTLSRQIKLYSCSKPKVCKLFP